jgi:hypothetical protein
MTIELLSFGIIAGFIGGFFGVGGGMVLIPLLLFIGIDMKSAIAISIMQMVFTSLFGTFLNYKKNKQFLSSGILLGLGGFSGGILSGYIVSSISGFSLQLLFLFIVGFAIYRVALTKVIESSSNKTHNKYLLLVIGFFIGLIAMSIGVGGSVMLTPILVSFMFYSLKDASSMGLFFVVFSSIAGFISLSLHGHMLYNEGFIVGTASLIGVYFGIKFKNFINIKSYKNYILVLYCVIFISVLYKLFTSNF